jgi:arylsulfatase A-like enzyme
VVFTSDNGPWLSYGDHAGSAGALREGKGTVWDGGVRVPFIARWPRHIPPGTICREPAMTIDLLPTFTRLAGAPLPERPIDGRDLWPLLAGERGAQPPRSALFLLRAERTQAVRDAGNSFSPHLPHPRRTTARRRPHPGPIPHVQAGVELYDMETDPAESAPAARHPDVAAEPQSHAERPARIGTL